FEQEVSLAANDSGRFEDRWVKLGADSSACTTHKWLGELSQIELPVRHGEGKFVTRSEKITDEILKRNLILWRYLDEEGNPTGRYPENPNGSVEHAAGLCDVSGRVIGMMPHPEAFLHPILHPDSAKHSLNEHQADGFRFFAAITRHIIAQKSPGEKFNVQN
ncbi:MAG: phosphoribosylformylglycinamidine synthase subunit PurQ, partial [Candidatus Riflebacteria bacterium]